jgi:hypothetical protein
VQQAIVQQGQLTLTHVQADEIRVKGKKGIFWMGLAMEVSSRLWLAGVVQSSRDHILADRLLLQVRRCACGASRLLICVDGWASYPNAILRAFVEQVSETIQTDKKQLQVWPRLVIGQVIKTQKKRRLVSVRHTLLRGDEQGLEACLEQSRGGTQINTAYIERLNGTMRERLASLTRKCRHASARLEAFQWGMYLIGCTYNLCWVHHQLGQTPAQAAGLTDQIWSLEKVLTYKVPPPILASAQEAERHSLVQPPDKPKGRRGRASKYYLILLKMKEEKARRQADAI